MSLSKLNAIMSTAQSIHMFTSGLITYLYVEKPIFDSVAYPDYPITFEGYSSDETWAVIQTRIPVSDNYFPTADYKGPWIWMSNALSKRKYMLTYVTYSGLDPDLSDVKLLVPFLWGYTTDSTYYYVRLFIPVIPIVRGAFWYINKPDLDTDASNALVNFFSTHKMFFGYLIKGR